MKQFNDIMGLARNCASLLTYEQQAALVSHMLEATNCTSNPVPELVNVFDALIVAAKYLDINPTWYEVGDYVKTPERKTDVPKGIEPERTGLFVDRITMVNNTSIPAYQRLRARDQYDGRCVIEGGSHFFTPEAYQPVIMTDVVTGDRVLLDGKDYEVSHVTDHAIYLLHVGAEYTTEQIVRIPKMLKKQEEQ